MRGINLDRMASLFRSNGITTFKSRPVSDQEPDDYAKDLYEAACVLDELVNKKGQKVFLHCTTGTTRGPTLVILYLSLFVRHEKWEDPEELERYLKSIYYLTNANLDMVERVLDEHSDVQEANLKRWL